MSLGMFEGSEMLGVRRMLSGGLSHGSDEGGDIMLGDGDCLEDVVSCVWGGVGEEILWPCSSKGGVLVCAVWSKSG